MLMAANHRSFSDPFMIGCCLGRPLHFVAKVELFDKRWKAWLLLALGAFPIRRGESDEDAMETARVILERGGVVGIFPEGTRVRPGPLGEPKRGVGPAGAGDRARRSCRWRSSGPSDMRRGWLIRPGRVTVRCGRALTFPRPLDREPRQSLAQEISNRVWSCISLQWEWLGGLQPIRHPVVVGAGSWGTAVATLLARSGATVQLVCRTPEQARELGIAPHERRLPAGRRAARGRAGRRSRRSCDWDEVDLVCLAVPSQSLDEALESVAGRMPDHVGVLVLSQGPDRAGRHASDARSSLERAGQRPVACLGGPGARG